MQNEKFGYFRFEKGGKVHYLDEIPGKSGLWALCGRHAPRGRLIPVDMGEAERDLCRTCKKVEDTEFWGWEQMI